MQKVGGFLVWRGLILLLLLVPVVLDPQLLLRVGGRQAVGQSPGLSNAAMPMEDVFTVVGRLSAENGAPNEHSGVVFHQGYVVEVYADETATPHSGISVFDFRNPAQPQLVARTETDTEYLSEQHTMAFSNGYNAQLAALLAVGGVEIWDWSDVQNMRRLSRLELPGVERGYGLGAWWLTWQAPYLYVSGASNGIYIVDVHDPTHPFLVDRNDQPNPMPPTETGGFRVGSIFAVGNLLVITSNDGRGYATLDIGDPRNPYLLDAKVQGTPGSYSSMVNGNRIYAAGTDDDLHGFDISDPRDIQRVASVAMAGRGGYLTIQDNYAHVGASSQYVKIDISDDDEYVVVGVASSGINDRDEDFITVLGNLAVVSDDRFNGSFIIPHQPEPDTTGPLVNMVVPADGAANLPRSSRVGLTFTDNIDLRSVNGTTFVVRPVGGEPLWGKYSAQTGIVNFAPDAPLEPNTIYEVIVPSGGIQDVSGNGVVREFRSTFSTGEMGRPPFECDLPLTTPVSVGDAVEFSAYVFGEAGSLSYRWDYGDGSAISESGASAIAAHTYTAPGRYTVRATASDGRYSAVCSAFQSVHSHPLPGSAPTSSSIILDRSGTQVWNVNPDHDSVTAIDAVHLQKMFETPVGKRPRSLAQAPDGTIWVANQGDDTISVLDDNGTLLATVALPRGGQPVGLVFNPTNAVGYVTLQARGTVARLDPGGRRLIDELAVGPTPRGLAVSHDGHRLFVTRFISPDTQGEVTEIDAVAWQVVRTISLGLDAGLDTENSGRGLPNGLEAPVISPDGSRLWIVSKKDNIARGLLRDGKGLTFESTVRAIVSQVDLTTNLEVLADRHDFNNREGAAAIRFSPLGDNAFVALRGSNAVEVLDAYSGQLVTSIEKSGIAPIGLVFTDDGSKLFVHGWLSRSVLVYDVSQIVNPGSQRAEFLGEVTTVAKEVLPEPVLAGKRIFFDASDPRMSRDGYLACGSCHLDEGDDGRVWDRTAEGEGLRNTISLVGHGSLEGRLHWSANFDEVQDFENDMRANFGGLGFLSDTQFESSPISQTMGAPKAGLSPELDALAAYVASLQSWPHSPWRAADGSLSTEGLAGRAVFDALLCAGCHGGEQFTDSGLGLLHNMGTIKPESGQRLGRPLLGMDTPTLRALWQSAPYLHDGSVATLIELFEAPIHHGIVGESKHPALADPQALEQLVQYLLQMDDVEPGRTLPTPSVAIADPVDGRIYAPGQPIRIAVDTTANVWADVAKVEFYADGVLVGVKETPLYIFSWEGAEVGDHAITARLVYTNGFSTVARSVRVSVR